ncbi:ADP-ribose diphosphatase [Actinomyces oris]|uniref:NUDIX domain-containing protein n=1 Tax=Actinomyces oris TaxID=544580 RepID=UPI00094D2011|nr:NUDIX hydrolase [Actinomyces oris]OLO79497.1 ADP-ribose diphosphatase [Actinomyces oris]
MDHPVTSTRSGDGLENSLADTREPGRELVSSERVWSGPIFAVDADQVRLGPGQEPVSRQVVVHHDAVAVVALREGEASSQADGAAEILMVRQYRHPVRACLWEIPAGLLDVAGEEPAVAAARELAEETDYEAATWNTLAEFYASPGFTTEGARIFLAQDLSLLPEDRRTVREDEEAEFVPTWVRLDEAVDAVMGGRLHNPSTVLGVLATAQARARGWAELRPADAPWLRSPESL